MTARAAGPRFDLHPSGAEHRPEWRRAVRALRQLVREPDRTELAYEISLAVDGDLSERLLLRMLRHRGGRRLFESRPSLLAALTDRDSLARMPEGSLGRAYLDHVDRHGLDPAKLVELGRRAGGEATSPEPAIRWIHERNEMMHDLWHVLTGYGADQLGEAALLPFSLAQNGGRANAILTLGASLRTLRAVGPRWLPYVWTSWRRGRRAVCLAALPYEELLPLPLDEVRAACGIDPPERAHPRGVLRGNVVEGLARA